MAEIATITKNLKDEQSIKKMQMLKTNGIDYYAEGQDADCTTVSIKDAIETVMSYSDIVSTTTTIIAVIITKAAVNVTTTAPAASFSLRVCYCNYCWYCCGSSSKETADRIDLKND